MPDMLLERACPGPVCGVDEAGRGPWAGPVCAAAVILRPRAVPKGVDDSKKLSAGRRAALEVEIKAKAVAWGVGFASVEEIATLNILHATGLAMRRAIAAMATAQALISSSSRSRALTVSSLESLTPSGTRSGSKSAKAARNASRLRSMVIQDRPA